MPSTYQIILKNSNGTQLTTLQDFFDLTYARRVNDVGVLTIIVPASYSQYLAIDGQIEIYRKVDNGPFTLDMDTRWFIRRPSRKLTLGGQEYIQIYAEDANTLLKRRVVAYYAGSSQSTKTGNADNLMKAIVRENMGSTASDYSGSAAARQLSSSLFSIQADLSQGASVTKSFAYRDVLSVLQELANASIQAGSYLAFDVFSIAGGTFEFRTYSGQRGVDHRWPSGSNPVILDPQFGNLGDIDQTDDYSDARSFIYCGGQGEGTARIIQTATDATLAGLSPYGRFEAWQDARQSESSASVLAEAQAELWSRRAKKTFEGTILETPAVRYGVNYGFGDIVTARYRGQQYDCRVDAVQITKASNTTPEQITTKIQSVS